MSAPADRPVNFYEKMPAQYKTSKGTTYKSYPEVHIELPFRALIVGASGSMKSNLAVNLILKLNCFTKIFLFCRNLQQPLYQFLIDTYQKIEKKLGIRILYFSEDIEDMPPLEAFNKNETNLVLIDDMILEKLKSVRELFVRSRPYNISILFLSQTYYEIPKLIRQNADILILKRINTKRDLTAIAKEYSLGSADNLIDLYTRSQCADGPDFLMIDLKSSPEYKYRINFTPIR